MSQIVPKGILYNILLTETTNVAGVFTAPNAHVYTNAIVLSNNIALADLTEATFGSYAPQVAVTLSAPVNRPDSSKGCEVEVAPWIAGTVVTPETCYGVYLTDVSNAILLSVHEFVDSDGVAAPITVVAGGDAVIPPTPLFLDLDMREPR